MSTTKKIQKINLHGTTYAIDVKKSWSENSPESVSFIKDRTHYIQSLLVSDCILPTSDAKWEYSFSTPLTLTLGKVYWLKITTIPNGSTLSGDTLEDFWLPVVYKEVNDSAAGVGTFVTTYVSNSKAYRVEVQFTLSSNGLTAEISDTNASSEYQNYLKNTQPLQIDIIADDEIKKLSSGYLNVKYSENPDEQLVTYPIVDKLGTDIRTEITGNINNLTNRIDGLNYELKTDEKTDGSDGFITSVTQTAGQIKTEKVKPEIAHINELPTKLDEIDGSLTDLSDEIDQLKEAIKNTQNIMNFRGAFDSFTNVEAQLKDPAPEEGDVIIILKEERDAYGTLKVAAGSEWVYSGGKWNEIGDESILTQQVEKLINADDKLAADIEAALTTAKEYAEAQDDILEASLIGGDTDTTYAKTIKGAKDFANAKATAAANEALNTAESYANELVANRVVVQIHSWEATDWEVPN